MQSFLPRTLLWRIGIVLMAAQVIILLALGWIGLGGVRDFHHEQVREELHRIESILAQSYQAAADLDLDSLDRLVKEDGAKTGVRITLIRPNGIVLADSEADPAAMENHRYGRAEIESALTTGAGSALRFSNTLKQDMIYFARTEEWPEIERIVVRLSLPLTRVDSELSSLRRLVVGAGVASILLTAVVVYLVSRRFSKQVETLAEAATRFARGELDYPVHPPASRELSRLATSLDSMGRQLSQRVAQLQAQQQEQRTILESMSNGVIALDREHRILNLNRAAEAMLGVSASKARGRLLQELARYPRLSELVARLISGQETSVTEIDISKEGVERRIIEVKGEILNTGDETQSGALLLLNDVTERHRFESLRTDFAANVSHELSTPITNIKGYVETLQDVGWSDAEQTAKFLNIIRTNSDRLAAIVEDVMSLTNLERPHFREGLDFEPFSASWLLKSIVEQFADEARQKSIRINVDAGEGIEIAGHSNLLQQAVGNLVSNAIRYSPSDSEVTLGVQTSHGECEIFVRDQGPGIPEDHLARLFERFYRVDKARSRELGGTGLGLAIVKHIAGMHGGRVDVKSVVGEGSTFTLILPRS